LYCTSACLSVSLTESVSQWWTVCYCALSWEFSHLYRPNTVHLYRVYTLAVYTYTGCTRLL